METTATTAYIGLGSNLGDRAGNLLLAVRCMLEASFDVVRLSSIYETEPVGLDTDLMFLNMVAEVRVSNISHTQMMARLLRIEYLLGRGDKTIKKPRTVDLDILL
ncbi:MAG: 2-amino-4-hydroxy-6-hydroxymethyldihydropteridine diphosphokinase [Acidobacteria bacterium]|nr:2-amino-4-hydroxy-6-hydroxymethyldihydropteridine diphosphokinase [Acidobacteriota bacterium]